jgi:large conductance mechanosensitive channel
MGMLKEFKEFAMRGNVVDMAVGIIIGGAFGAIVKSLVDDVIMPPIGMLTGKVDFKSLNFPLKEATTDAAGKPIPAVNINYGAFINNCITFLIVAFAVFLLVKAINTARAQMEEQPATPEAPPPEDIKLLREIRDSLRKY